MPKKPVTPFEPHEQPWDHLAYKRIHAYEILPGDSEGRSGHTGFFRYTFFQSRLIRELVSLPRQEEMRILIAPGSVGCEALTLGIYAAQWELAKKHGSLKIDSVDVSGTFTAIARAGVYPEELVEFLPAHLRRYFNDSAHHEGYVCASDKAKRHITFLPECDLMDFHPEKPYDAVIAANFLQWVRPDHVKYMDKLCSLSKSFICCTIPGDEDAWPLTPGHPFVKNGLKLVDEDDWKKTRQPERDDFIFMNSRTNGMHVFKR